MKPVVSMPQHQAAPSRAQAQVWSRPAASRNTLTGMPLTAVPGEATGSLEPLPA